MILSAQSIKDRKYMITPFVERQTQNGLTYGLGACGYDIRTKDGATLFPGDFRLLCSLERFDIPDDLMMRIVDKSTWARHGLFVQNTVAEPGWCGYLTLEITNQRSLQQGPITINDGDPIAQVIFDQLDKPTSLPYRGKYQDQPQRAMPALLSDKV